MITNLSSGISIDPAILEENRNILFSIIPFIVLFVTLISRYFQHKKQFNIYQIILFGLLDSFLLISPFKITNIGLGLPILVILYYYINYRFLGRKKAASSLVFLFLNIFIIYLIISLFAAGLGVPE